MSSKEHKILVVGAGLTGSVIARELANKGFKVDVIDSRAHIGGNCYTHNVHGNTVHEYGPHIFHTSDDEVIDYIKQFDDWKEFINQPLADYNGERYNLPFNMNTFYQIYGVKTLGELNTILEKDRVSDPQSTEEYAVNSVGRKAYEKLIKGYTEKQWNRNINDVPSNVLRRIPIRTVYDNNYFNDKFQAIPLDGYTKFIKKILTTSHISIMLNTEYTEEMYEKYDHIFYTGGIDQYFNYCYGNLEYRGLRFEHYVIPRSASQCNAVVNCTDRNHSYTRTIEHKYFLDEDPDRVIKTYEYPSDYNGKYYPINDDNNNALYEKYASKCLKDNIHVTFCGRLGSYRYMNMDQCIREALDVSRSYLETKTS